jgi:hypothetical protein
VPLEPLEGTMLLKPSPMRRVRIDPVSHTARAEAGALWKDVTVPASGHGLAALAGTSPNVGVTGYTLGGGDRDAPLPGARAVRRSAVLPDPAHLRGPPCLAQWTDTVPDEITSIGRILRLPPLPEIPEILRGRALAVVEAAYLGDASAGAELIRPLRALGPDADTPLLSIEVRHLGGALARQAPGGGAQARIDANYAAFASGFTPTSELGDAVRAHAQALEDALRVWRADHDHHNFVETPADAHVAFPRASDQRCGKSRPGTTRPGDHLRPPCAAGRALT